jgi:hypothetical protein
MTNDGEKLVQRLIKGRAKAAPCSVVAEKEVGVEDDGGYWERRDSVVVRRKADGVKGSLEFRHRRRFYFNFVPDGR